MESLPTTGTAGGGGGTVNTAWQTGQGICMPALLVSQTMFCPHLGHANLKSLMNASGASGGTYLRPKARKNKSECVTQLLKNGAGQDKQDSQDGKTVLPEHVAADVRRRIFV